MARGPKPRPDAVKALMGNPGRRRLALGRPAEYGEATTRTVQIDPPPFLTDPAQQQIFRWIVEDPLQRRLIRPADILGYGRFAAYVHIWIGLLERSSRGEDVSIEWLARLERMLITLEDRLGLNPTARQHLVRALATLPAVLAEAATPKDEPEVAKRKRGKPAAPASPLGFLQAAREDA